MKTVNEYFLKMANRISFVNLRKGANYRIKDYTIVDDIPLPIITDTLISEIKDGDIADELKVIHLIEGIIYILGIDYDFKYNQQYKDILCSFYENVEDYLLYRGLSFYDVEQYDDSAIFLRALININSNNIIGLFNYGLALEQIDNKFMGLNQEKRK